MLCIGWHLFVQFSNAKDIYTFVNGKRFPDVRKRTMVDSLGPSLFSFSQHNIIYIYYIGQEGKPRRPW